MIKEKHIKEMSELMTLMNKITEEYQIFCKEHPDEDRFGKEEDIANAIYSISEMVSEIFNNKDTSCCVEE